MSRGIWVLLPLAWLSCKVNIPLDATFACLTDADCDGDGFRCVVEGRAVGICCKPSAEVCDGRDNDCNGKIDDGAAEPCYTGPQGTENVGRCRAGLLQCVQGSPGTCLGEVVPAGESCNGQDDDCDGEVDEDFDLLTHVEHCGACGQACGVDMKCEGGSCTTAIEKLCSDGLDDEGDQKIDCADDDCEGDPCGDGCTCRSLAKAESACGDGLDNEGDGPLDCADPDCEGLDCGTGCTCLAGAKSEADCGDGLDNDGDTLTDCADPDCNQKACGSGCLCDGNQKKETDCRDAKDNDGDGAFDCVDADCVTQLCKPAPQTFVCNGSGQCVCNGVPNPPAEVGVQCTDSVDNNCNGLIDCAEIGCNNQSCGAGCLCKLGVRTESVCDDFMDNDGDGKTDCADTSNCPVNTPCKYLQGMSEKNGTCRADGTCR